MSQVIPFPVPPRSNTSALHDVAKALHQTHYERLCIKASAHLDGEVDAEDAVQEAFVVFLGLPALPQGDAASYLVSILRRVCRDRLHERSTDRRIRDESVIELGEGNRWKRGVGEDFSLSHHAFLSDQRTSAPRERRRSSKTRSNQTR